MSFETFCTSAGIAGNVKLAFATWLGESEIGRMYNEAMWRVKWERFKRITGETPRRAKAL